MTSLWVSDKVLQDLVGEADRAYPLETGGVLVGYFAESGEPVIYAAIGPGPAAIHRRRRFTPDHAWQCRQLDEIFEQSSGRLVYVGDWHTHPDASPRMSWLDHRTLRTIARHRQAQAPHPLMLIGGGEPENWIWAGHLFREERLLGFLTECDHPVLRLF